MKTKEQLLSNKLKRNGRKLVVAEDVVAKLRAERTKILKAMAQTVVQELQAGVPL